MKFGKVIGHIVATEKSNSLNGLPLLVVRLLNEKLEPLPAKYVCTDTVKARPGDIVLTCGSSSARSTAVTRDACTDNSIIAIVDIVSAGKEDVFRKE